MGFQLSPNSSAARQVLISCTTFLAVYTHTHTHTYIQPATLVVPANGVDTILMMFKRIWECSGNPKSPDGTIPTGSRVLCVQSKKDFPRNQKPRVSSSRGKRRIYRNVFGNGMIESIQEGLGKNTITPKLVPTIAAAASQWELKPCTLVREDCWVEITCGNTVVVGYKGFQMNSRFALSRPKLCC